MAILRSDLFQKENEIAWEDLGNGIQRQVFGYDERIMLVKAKFEKDAIGELHEHHHTQVTYVASGVFEMTIGDKVQIISAGDGYYVPPHVIHGCVLPGTRHLNRFFYTTQRRFSEYSPAAGSAWKARVACCSKTKAELLRLCLFLRASGY
jgi:quercetin dioxygenase-like cupin family protein